MPRATTHPGTCLYCAAEVPKRGSKTHLAKCPARAEAISKSMVKPGRAETLFHLRVQDAAHDEFWLDLEMRGSATLKDLDFYLRGIWLECCGHLSQFTLGGWGGVKVGKQRTLGDVFATELKIEHIYDFGTSSHTYISAVDVREGKATTRRPVALLARNLMPKCDCLECKHPAGWLCIQCVIEDDTFGTLCAAHTKTHPHTEYGEPLALVNSPRLGLCGYHGPAEPPY